MHHRLLLLGWTGLVVAVAGCSSSGTPLRQVTGKVTWNGNPLPAGDIVFIPEDKSFGAEAGKIKDGQYSLQARSGKNRVEIRASRPVPGKFRPSAAGDGKMQPVIEDYIPPEYNTGSTLTAEVASGKTTFDFDPHEN